MQTYYLRPQQHCITKGIYNPYDDRYGKHIKNQIAANIYTAAIWRSDMTTVYILNWICDANIELIVKLVLQPIVYLIENEFHLMPAMKHYKRLGKPTQNLLVSLYSLDHVKLILSNAKQLRSSVNQFISENVFINAD